ncbi:acetyl/propionyl-CoA carboxylase subunit alpha [Rhodococcus sp. BP-149]|jgi:propionyl-CoA carboxylase alpha chain|uniref:acetyl/propionyl/methylcrotonyl-CoA carboxylase subunit alpha n=1 Tax=unclassified Rhodococcus (in: high G+C Gram-positive bacteria) TaxID=192944 RepID=UPI001C9AC79D|nr:MULTISPECIES: biotin carboxylase N-terminal domain-containing protein [unclassified Rhodococcus (in: high G+C Gram-positive bacteria)]MBY6685073.1 acetyl/propionyl-CoA carboxylase subunit alpha [Rhodococcus sp. BP-288]MBY6692443.1 acetyl/propionyl-CoA carboxylase subunit alpha [Rhodococcus sp. BP-188]MBY6698341.1 acetyl/propionyl-CoA carboxylase subunit alpha [Rhodococcus sp. BP-285]MBY6701020.1 acetyl/propionyl-CoA carboxylase subunit alpha [Rhodococcus sp. BP-283]MBY6712021.1 acetyl/propi
MTISSVLVANRGEIARRVFTTCRAEGIDTVAVFSDPDSASPHVADADVAVRLPGSASSETYLRGDLIIEAAQRAGADAIHPGYGFLSENAEFARAVQDAGLTWIGPPVKAIESMGSKVESKAMMQSAGVPVLDRLDPASVTQDDLPVLVKASAGGGGRGMRVVRELDALQDEIDAASREALSAFGDATVFCERYLETGRHIEVQVMADRHGTVWAVGERECSIQRRHQKVVEEAPSPLVERVPGMREKLFEAARIATEALDYEGAGTVEFLSDERGNFYFLEMNTRLQVEHPVTECTTGLDLVALQIHVAAGGALPAEQPTTRGHSIEVRLYAEDPARDWQPQSGVVHHVEFDGAREFEVLTRTGLRVDSGIVDGSVVGTHYDPMLAKVISYAPTREQAAGILAKALLRSRIHGVRTNRDLLVTVLRHPAFLAGDTDTAFFATHDLAVLARPLVDDRGVRLSALAAALADATRSRESATVGRSLPSGWRNLASVPQRKTYAVNGTEIVAEYRLSRGTLVTDVDDCALVRAESDRVVLLADGVRREFHVAVHGDAVFVDSSLGPVRLERVPVFVDPSEIVAAGSLLAPMPGSVVRIGAAVGDTVTAGQPILWLEAMKMEHTITAPAAGVLTELTVTVGHQVDVDAVLAVVAAEGDQA